MIMAHNQIRRIFYIATIGLLITTALVVGIYQGAPQVFATPGAMPFGGKIVSAVPAIVPPAPALCPAHTVINNSVESVYLAAHGIIVPPVIGIYTTPPYSLIFLYSNLITPGVNILGEYVPLPFPTCNLPYPVYSGFLYPTYGLFGIGTSALPGF
jgi:hypothetical protein